MNNALRSYQNLDVLEFYKSLPFNINHTVEQEAAHVKDPAVLRAQGIPEHLLKPGLQVLDVGCGVGWLSNAMAYHHKVRVTGIDFNPVAIGRAQEVARSLDLDVDFKVRDLFTFNEGTFDFVSSVGVLHHTNGCFEAITHICRDLVKKGGHFFCGLYHTYGREPFLRYFDEARKAGESEDKLYARYRELHSSLQDETLLRSWFRDQVLHPHETQHTLKEIVPLIEKEGMQLVSTSINRFGPVTNKEEIYALEPSFKEMGEARLKERKYFPGFFLFLCKKVG